MNEIAAAETSANSTPAQQQQQQSSNLRHNNSRETTDSSKHVSLTLILITIATKHLVIFYILLAQDKEKKDKYNLEVCHELRKDLVPPVYSVDGIAAGKEARATEKRLMSVLAKKLRRPYS